LLFQNLAAMVEQDGADEKLAFLKSIQEMLESDDDMKVLASKTEMLLSQRQEQDKEEGKDVISRANMKLFKSEVADGKRIVQYQAHS